MTLEVSLRRPFSLPRVFRTEKNEPQRDYHWIGHKQKTGQTPDAPGEKSNKQQDKKSDQKYRPLTDITLGEVEDVYTRFEHQLLFARENWLGKNHFCQIPLKRGRGYPPLVFGRVKTCYPSDGVLDNIEELELYFPQKDRAPDVLHLHKDEIRRSSQKHAQSYFVRVRVFASEREATELSEAASLLGMNGFYPEFDTGYLDLLDMTSQNQTSYPWLYVIGSRWFDSVPDSLQTEMAGKLKEMIGWDRRIFNYHPGWLSNEINTLNRTLGFKYGFTDTVLTEPGDAKQVGFIVAKLFEQSILHL